MNCKPLNQWLLLALSAGVIGTAQAEEGRLVPYLSVQSAEAKLQTRLTGQVKSARTIGIKAEVEGVLQQVVEEGHILSAGTELASIRTTSVETGYKFAADQVTLLKSQLVLKQEQFKRVKKLHAQGKASEQTLDTARLASHEVENAYSKAKERLAKLTTLHQKRRTKVDFEAIVTKVHRFEQDYVEPGDVIVELVDKERLYIDVALSDSLARKLNEQTQITINVDGHSYAAQIGNIYGFVDAATQQRKVRITGKQQSQINLLPGQLVAIDFTFDMSAQNCFAVPRDLVHLEGAERWVWVADAEQKVRKRNVGARVEGNMGQNSIVCQGVKADDKLLSNQFIRYKEGEEVRLAEAGGGTRL